MTASQTAAPASAGASAVPCKVCRRPVTDAKRVTCNRQRCRRLVATGLR